MRTVAIMHFLQNMNETTLSGNLIECCSSSQTLQWIPSFFLWIFTPLEIYFLQISKNRDIPLNFFNGMKMVLILTMVSSSAAEIIFPTKHHKVLFDALTSIAPVVTYILYLGLTMANMKMGVQSSGIMFLYSLLLLICEILQMFTHAGKKYTFHWYNSRISLASVGLLFFLNCFADSRPQHQLHPVTKNSCPEKQSSFLSQLFYYWFDALIWKAHKSTINFEDLWSVDHDKTSAYLAARFDKHLYPSVKAEETISVARSIWKMFRLEFIGTLLLKAAQELCVFTAPVLLGFVINFVHEDEPFWKGYMYAGLMLTVNMLYSFLSVKYYHYQLKSGLEMRTCVYSAIYSKLLRISYIARLNFSTGNVLNLVAVDARRFFLLFYYAHLFFATVIEITVVIIMLFYVLGTYIVPGLIVLLLLIPLNIFIAVNLKELKNRLLKIRDQRVKQVHEILTGIRVLKLYAWELSFEQQIMKTRDKELKLLRRQAYIESISFFMSQYTPPLVVLITVGNYVLADKHNHLSADVVFVTHILLNILKNTIYMIPTLIPTTLNIFFSIRRVDSFLNAEELHDYVSHEPASDAVVVQNGTFSWETDGPVILKNVNINIREGSLVAVIGSVGSGKTALLQALLGEMHKVSGEVNIKDVGPIGYVPQEAWLLNATIKQNITFGAMAEGRFYDQIIYACALKPDLDNLPAGDETEVGEKGINLSGGQKQRISLARAIFSKANTYLFDDPFSAVDASVTAHIFDRVFGRNGLLNQKTRILVTHNVNFLSETDLIIVLKNGVISESGSYQELKRRNGEFYNFLLKYQDMIMPSPTQQPETSFLYSKSNKDKTIIEKKQPEETHSANTSGKLTHQEHTETGRVKSSIYKYYVSEIGCFFIIICTVTTVAYHGITMLTDIKLANWVSDNSTIVNGVQDIQKRNHYLTTQIIYSLSQAIFCLSFILALYTGLLKAAKSMHKRLLANVLRWPIRSFDITPTGRIINRFTSDIYTIDVLIIENIGKVLPKFGSTALVLIIVIYTAPVLVVIIVPVVIFFFFLQKLYLKLSQRLRRIESTTRSPQYTHFTETINGLLTIRAFKLAKIFIGRCREKIDAQYRVAYPSALATRWLVLRLECLTNLIIFSLTMFAVTFKGSISEGLIGLSISYALQLTSGLAYAVKLSSDVENDIICVERIKEFVEYPQEARWEDDPDYTIPTDWPSQGEVTFQNYQCRYREGLDLALKNFTLSVKSQEKVAIVGRTGAGKSTLALALFRIIEPSGGKILIDGIDISKIGLHTLRSKLSIIPQDPILFSGSLRINLDPENKYSDETIWGAIKSAHLRKHIPDDGTGLNFYISESGSNISAGQRQLVCLARALLRNSRILILDEATAAVDLETDRLFQNTIREKFRHCTIITIAHRIKTIMDYDRIVVIDNGELIEQGPPKRLLRSSKSAFYKMVSDAGLI